jgi:DNA-directed RNA polymerase subunit F
MCQIAVDDTLIKEARSVTTMEDDQEIVAEALHSFIAQMKDQRQALQYFGKLKSWDPEFAGLNEKWKTKR